MSDDKFHPSNGWLESLEDIYDQYERQTNLWWRIVWAAATLAVSALAFHLIWGFM